MNALAKVLSSQIRAGIFEILFGLRDRPAHMREIERLSGFAIGTIQQDLKKLEALDLVTRRKDGNRVYYEANKNHPLYPEIRNLVLKTVGLADVLKKKNISINGITDIAYKKSMDALSSDTHLPLDNFVATEAFLIKSLEY